MSRFSIITGDMVSSHELDKNIREDLYTAIDEFAKTLRRKWIDRYERFRGDSVQCSVVLLPQAMRVALLLRLIIAHLLADFYLQRNDWVNRFRHSLFFRQII